MKYSPSNSTVSISLKESELLIENHFDKKIEEEKENLFQPFKRGSNTSGTHIEGAGLGLSIVKNILTLLHLEYSLEIDKNVFKFSIFFKL